MYGGIQDGLGGWHGQDSLWADFVEERKGFGQGSLGCVKMELLCELVSLSLARRLIYRCTKVRNHSSDFNKQIKSKNYSSKTASNTCFIAEISCGNNLHSSSLVHALDSPWSSHDESARTLAKQLAHLYSMIKQASTLAKHNHSSNPWVIHAMCSLDLPLLKCP